MRKLLIPALVIAIGCLAASRADARGRRSDPAWKAQHAHPGAPTSGGVCPTPPVVASLPFVDSDNTCRVTSNAITNYGGVCGTNLPFPYPGQELIYQLGLGTGNNVGFSADLTGSTGDLAIFVVGSTCGSGVNCVANSQDAIGPGQGPEVINPASYPVGTYFVYMDSYYAVGQAGSCGTYTLTISGTLPAELLEFKAE